MNQYYFVNELRSCLSFMSREERDAALRYYEEYFAEAGPEREREILSELGSPSKVAEDIRRDYFMSKEPTGRDLAAPGGAGEASPPPNWAPGTPPGFGGAGIPFPPPPNAPPPPPPPNGGRGAPPPNGWGGYAPPPYQQAPGREKKRFPVWLIVLLIVFAVPVGIPLISVAFSLIVAAFAVVFSLLLAFCGAGLGIFAGGIYAFISGFWALGFMPDALMLFGSGLVLAAVGLPLMWLGVWIFAKLFKLLCRGVSALISGIFGRKGDAAA